MSERKLIIVSNRLPLEVRFESGEWQMKRSSGGLASALDGISRQISFDWVGWPGTDVPARERPALTRRLSEEYRYYPVFLTQTEIDRFYNGFSNRVLWPLFHYLPSRADFSLRYWKDYQEVNQKFADHVLAIAKNGDLVWVHDYHLFLVPALLREKNPALKIGFFLHTPFPSSEIYRLLPVRREILEGLLGSDLIGFQTPDYLRHFTNTCLRVLGIETRPHDVLFNSRRVQLRCHPIGIATDRFVEQANSEPVQEKEKKLRRDFANQKIVLGVDRLDHIKGISLKLKAYEEFLERYPELAEKSLLLQVAVPSRSDVREYREMKRDIDGAVGRINGRFGTPHHTPIAYLAHPISPDELCALYKIADVILITSVRDGMNLVSHEYVACQGDKSGVLILSEFAGASYVFPDALLVNPWDIQQVAKSIRDALLMPDEDKAARAQKNFANVRAFNSLAWARRFVKDLRAAPPVYTQPAQNLKNFYLLLQREYGRAATRLILLDYDGTLVPFESLPEKATPPKALLSLLSKFTDDERNSIYLVSGRDRNQLAEWFSPLPRLGLSAEHGLFLKRPVEIDWLALENPPPTEWLADLLPILEEYTRRTPGSFIETKTHSLAWHYRDADPEFGEWQAHEIALHIDHSASKFPIEPLFGNRVLEIRPRGIHKGKILRYIAGDSGLPRFILAFGDDATDEDLFAALPAESWSCRVGSSETLARFYLDRLEETIDVLAELAGIQL